MAITVDLFTCTFCVLSYSVAQENSDCPLPDLLGGFLSVTKREIPLCDPSAELNGTCTVEFVGGSVTYNGNSSGSIAFYNVTESYCINSTPTRECVAGMWINDVLLERGVYI